MNRLASKPTEVTNKPGEPKRIAFLGNCLPRLCGIATFTHDLASAVAAASPTTECFIAAINDKEAGYAYPPIVRCTVAEKRIDSYRHAADFLNFSNAEALCVQHEFGIYGGRAGSHLLALLREARMPVVTTLHTILSNPDATQLAVMKEVAKHSDRLVVMAAKGSEILQEVYAVPPEKIDLIPHGIPDWPLEPSAASKAQFGVDGCMVLLTFGLLGPGKGIEHVIQGLPSVLARHPNVVYLVLGATHPHLIASEGERYRLSLERLAEDNNVREQVIFYNRFVSPEDLREFIRATDIYVTPYLNEAQITSGTLANVFGSGKVVVSTPYWHAQELLANGCGALVPFHSPQGIADAVARLLSAPEQMEAIGRRAHQIGRSMIWPAVGASYLASFQRARAERRALPRTAFGGWTLASRPSELPPLRLDHVRNLTDATGIFQHALYNVPNFHEGYCVDDNARAYLLCLLLGETGETGPGSPLPETDRLANTYMAFLSAALNYETGLFRNFMSHGRQWLEAAGSEDSHGRSLWAVGSGAARSKQEGHRRLCAQLFEKSIDAVNSFTSPRAWGFTLLGIHEYLKAPPATAKPRVAEVAIALRANLVERLKQLWKACSTEHWPWFELSVTYDNARLCQALIASGTASGDTEAVEIGLASLRWLASIQKTPTGCLRPIGCNGFFYRDGARADFDQQPVEAQAMVSACFEALRATGDAMWQREARRAFEWFLGRNDLSLPLVDFTTGGCGDGLHQDRVSENQGAESTLAFHLSLAEMRASQAASVQP